MIETQHLQPPWDQPSACSVIFPSPETLQHKTTDHRNAPTTAPYTDVIQTQIWDTWQSNESHSTKCLLFQSKNHPGHRRGFNCYGNTQRCSEFSFEGNNSQNLTIVRIDKFSSAWSFITEESEVGPSEKECKRSQKKK